MIISDIDDTVYPVALKQGWSVGGTLVAMAVKKGKKKDGSGIQQAAGLIRYFDEESEDAWHFTKGQIYTACILLSSVIYLANHGVMDWFFGIF